MNLSGSLSEFFFIVLPGIYFIVLANYFFKITNYLNIHFNELSDLMKIFTLLSVGFIIGFLLHVIMRFLKSTDTEKKVFETILGYQAERNNFDVAKNLMQPIIKDLELSKFKDKESEIRKQVFYLANNYVWAKGHGLPSIVFAQRLVFWGNLFFASFIILVILLFNLIINITCGTSLLYDGSNFSLLVYILLIALLTYIQYFSYYQHIKSLYSTVLSTFIAVRKLDS